MSAELLGVPLLFWGLGCLLMAALWSVVWPARRVTRGGAAGYVVLRWFHALTWLLLAMAAFAGSLDPPVSTGLVRFLALLALMVYTVFVVALLRSKTAQ
jgi:hypothetical protein